MMWLDEETVAFLADLKAHNERGWFEGNKDRYRDFLKEPAEHFVSEVADLLRSETGTACKPKIFRIHRDVRFSRDKTPYNAHLHMSFTAYQAGDDAPMWMIGLEPGCVVVGVGLFAFSPAGLERWRRRVAGSDGDDLRQILNGLLTGGVRLEPPELKRVPAPYPAGHANADLLKRKGIAVWIDIDDQCLAFGPSGPQNCVDRLLTLKPVSDWLLESD